ncbi:MAG: DNA mismatch repair protein MutL [uncultured archaeon A07HN63]|nr:MAG: DNA mismatch repair protein MutL [uncultured archaeon A07HN63]
MTDSESEPQATEIQPLDDRTVQRIAAGEVVERPASVIKELLENSLDAGASRITVTVAGGGTEFLQVSDDGHGIPESELELAVAEHATSKISDIDDLAGVASLGFRGEALSTIGAVSRLTIRSRPPEASSGAEITVEGGDVGDIEPAGCPEGTTVEVEDLFFNTPAREKFLKQDRTEFDHINTVVSQYALANPDVAITLEHDGRELFATEGAGSLRSAVLSVYGREVAESMIDIEYEADGDGPIEGISGLVSDPETTRSTREYLATFVNDRYVTAATLRNAVIAGYGGQLAPDRYPFAVLFVEVPPDAVDVNVHPRKTEVRFDDEDTVETAVQQAVEDALIDNGLIRSSAPRGRSAPEETTIQPDTAAADAADGEGDTASTESPTAEASTTQDQAPSSASASGQQSVDESESSAKDESAAEDEPPTDSETPTAADPVDPAAEDSWVVDDIDSDASPTTRADTSSSDSVPSGLESGSTVDSASTDAGDSASQGQSAATETAEASTTGSEPPATAPEAGDSHEQRVDTDEQRAATSTTDARRLSGHSTARRRPGVDSTSRCRTSACWGSYTTPIWWPRPTTACC